MRENEEQLIEGWQGGVGWQKKQAEKQRKKDNQQKKEETKVIKKG